jgi:asparagine synthase (glutamine-hydrolysing)
MCGLAGVVALGGPWDRKAEEKRAWVEQMLEPLAHRGPDGQGTWVEGPAALGHRRLAVIDLVTGAQPMADARGRVVGVFNGEIYNFRELRQELAARGYRFRTRSDTEVLLNAYLEYGPACLDRLEGMFAFALWDRGRRRLFAARDRFGEKPFFYLQQGELLAFASEAAAFRPLPFFTPEVDAATLVRFLAYEYLPTPESIYQGLKKLPPAHYLLWDHGRLTLAPYWQLPAPAPRPPAPMAELEEELRRLLSRAVTRRLVSDVPLGVFLSGGVDSSTVTALMAREVARVRTFTIGFVEKSYDESPEARRVAARCRTEHTEEILSAAACGELLPEIVVRLDEPLADPSIVPTYLLSRLARRRVTVALGGDGGDELFFGYETFPAFRLAQWCRRLPGFRPDMLLPLTGLLPGSTNYTNPRLVATLFLQGLQVPPWRTVQTWLTAMSPEVQQALWRRPPTLLWDPEALFAPTRRLYEAAPGGDPLDRLGYTYARQYLVDYILMKVDRCSMLHGLEVRAPFLDRDLAEFVCRLPHGLKLKGFRRKYLLLRALRQLLPRENLHRPKRGFLIPTALWLKGVLRPVVEDLLGERRLRDQGLFRPEAVRRLLKDHFSGRADHRKALWTLLVLQLWLHHWRPRLVPPAL